MLLACESNSEIKNAEVPDASKRVIADSNSRTVTNANLHSAIIGVWARPGDENSSFEISADSIFYTDSFLWYPYKLQNDTLSIVYENYRENYKVLLRNNDTLVLENHDQHIFIRFRN